MNAKSCESVGKTWKLYDISTIEYFPTFDEADSKLEYLEAKSEQSECEYVSEPHHSFVNSRIRKPNPNYENYISGSEFDITKRNPTNHSQPLVIQIPFPTPPMKDTSDILYQSSDIMPSVGEIETNFCLGPIFSTSSDIATQCNLTTEGFGMQQILETQKTIVTTLALMKRDVDMLLTIAGNKALTNVNPPAQQVRNTFTRRQDFPLKLVTNVTAFEELLNDEAIMAEFVTFLKMQGGRNKEEYMDRAMKKLLCDSLGAQYSFQGRRGKLPFFKLSNIWSGIKTSIDGLFAITEHDKEMLVKEWLVNTGCREGKRVKRTLAAEISSNF